MNNDDELDLFYVIPSLIKHMLLIGTWSDHPGKQYYHKTYGSVLAN